MGKNRDKFVELAENRVSRVVKDIRLIGNLSNRTNYSYTDEDVKKIVSTLKSPINSSCLLCFSKCFDNLFLLFSTAMQHFLYFLPDPHGQLLPRVGGLLLLFVSSSSSSILADRDVVAV